MIEKLIPSQYVRKYIEKENFQFQDIDIATIIYHSSLDILQKRQHLIALMEKTMDTVLRDQISQRIAYDERCLELFLHNDGSCFYETSVDEYTEEWDSGNVTGHFSSVDLAINHAKSFGVAFSIHKHQIIGLCQNIIVPQDAFNPRLFPHGMTDERSYLGDAISACRYSAEGQLKDFWSYEISKNDTAVVEDWGANRFEWQFVRMPNPFECGDIVRSTASNKLGIVATSQADWKQLLQRFDEGELVFDYTDASITVEFQQEDGTRSHEHIQPIYLEKA